MVQKWKKYAFILTQIQKTFGKGFGSVESFPIRKNESVSKKRDIFLMFDTYNLTEFTQMIEMLLKIDINFNVNNEFHFETEIRR